MKKRCSPILLLVITAVVAAASVAAVAAAAATAQELSPMAATADPAFEVATIKLSDPNGGSSGFQTSGHRVLVLNESVTSMLMFAYGVQRKQVVNTPSWLETDHFDVAGIPDIAGEPNVEQYRVMVRKLLADRFHLQFHRDQREMSIYVLSVGKSGSKLTPSASNPQAGQDQTGNGGAINDWRLTNNSMPEFTKFLETQLDRPVVDGTGLTGKYDFRLKWASEQAQEADPNTPPTLFTAIQEQLGLKLQPTRGMAEVLVVSHVDRPSAN